MMGFGITGPITLCNARVWFSMPWFGGRRFGFDIIEEGFTYFFIGTWGGEGTAR